MGVITAMKRISSQLTLFHAGLGRRWGSARQRRPGRPGCRNQVCAGGEHHAGGRAAEHGGAHEGEAVHLQRAGGGGAALGVELKLAGPRRSSLPWPEEIPGRQQAQVGRHQIPADSTTMSPGTNRRGAISTQRTDAFHLHPGVSTGRRGHRSAVAAPWPCCSPSPSGHRRRGWSGAPGRNGSAWTAPPCSRSPVVAFRSPEYHDAAASTRQQQVEGIGVAMPQVQPGGQGLSWRTTFSPVRRRMRAACWASSPSGWLCRRASRRSGASVAAAV